MKITITGSRREGKTQVAAYLLNLLDSIGYSTEYIGHNREMEKHVSKLSATPFNLINDRTITIVDIDTDQSVYIDYHKGDK